MNKFGQKCLETLHSRSADEYLKHLVQFANSYDFGLVSALVVIDHSPTLTEFSGITNAPAEFLDIYHDLDEAAKDPVAQHCKRSHTPIIWDADTYFLNNSSQVWEEQAVYGYKSGIAMALHLPHGKHFLLGIDRDAQINKKSRAFEGLVSEFMTFATFAQAAAFELIFGADSDTHDPAISQRELDALRLTADGNTCSDIAKRVGASERTIDLRLKNVARKLGCSSKYEAVLRAIRLGYVSV
jgi:DNA-binding CsgD family transcriptional regulator